MSINGKKIAQASMAMDIAKALLNVEIKAHKQHPIIAALARESAARACTSMSSALSATPHQYFNGIGKIDKRKQKRHDSKHGIKTHNIRLIRAKCGEYVIPVTISIKSGDDD